MNFYVYILWSESSNIFYIGYSNNPEERLISHNTSSKVSFTSKHRPWILKAKLSIGNSEASAMKVERYIKGRKSRSFILKCIEKQHDTSFIEWMISKT